MTDAAFFDLPGSETPRDSFSAREAMLGWMQEIAPYGIFTTDTALRIQSWNQWLVTHSGLTTEKVVGRLLLEVFPELEARRLDEHYRRALTGEVSVLSTALHKHLLAFPVAVRGCDVPHMLQTVRIAPLPAGDLIVGTITIIEDVTQRETHAITLQRQQEHDRLLSTALGLLLQSSNPLKDVAELFPKIAPPLGLEAYLNHSFHAETQALHLNAAGGIPPRQKEIMTVLSVGQSVCGQCALDRQTIILSQLDTDSERSPAELRGTGMRLYCCFPLIIGSRLLGTLSFGSYRRDSLSNDEVDFLSTLTQYVAIAMDRVQRETELRQAQQSLREHADSLETKITERTLRLHDTIAQLESFSYTVAHDLRAPIRSLKGYSEILSADYGASLPEEAQFIIGRLHRASDRLDVLTRDLLRFSKIARQEVELAPVDVDELVQDIILLTPSLENGVVRVVGQLGKICAQRTLLQQCLSNLFDNALKFVSPGVQPQIVIRSELRLSTQVSDDVRSRMFNPSTRHPYNDTTILPGLDVGANRCETSPQLRTRIWVQDNGIGVPVESNEKIFGIFERGIGHETIEGTGIGLAIVARAMQRMNGSYGVESEPGKGSRFWLEFPAAQVDSSDPSAVSSHESGPSGQ